MLDLCFLYTGSLHEEKTKGCALTSVLLQLGVHGLAQQQVTMLASDTLLLVPVLLPADICVPAENIEVGLKGDFKRWVLGLG